MKASARPPVQANIEEVREGLNGIVSDGHRASDIITNLRAMFKHDVQEKTLVDINKLVSVGSGARTGSICRSMR